MVAASFLVIADEVIEVGTFFAAPHQSGHNLGSCQLGCLRVSRCSLEVRVLCRLMQMITVQAVIAT
jgi:hypothetical protein